MKNKKSIERYFYENNEWKQLKKSSHILRILVVDYFENGYCYFKPISGYKYRSNNELFQEKYKNV